MNDFVRLGISSWLIERLEAIGIKRATEIQEKVLPILLDTKNRSNVFACSRTGSGKTLAYVLPILERLLKDPKPYFALILAPTRELAYQIQSVINILTGKSSSRSGNSVLVKSILVIGGGNYGMDEEDESQGLWLGKPNIIVATPGRLLDLFVNRNYLGLTNSGKRLKFSMLVMDEADQLITQGFCQQMKDILDWLDSNEAGGLSCGRQTLVFSATLTPALEQLQSIISKKDSSYKTHIVNLLPSTEKLKLELATNPELVQRYILCPEYVKSAYLVECLLDLEFKQLILFCATKREAKLIHRILITLGLNGGQFNFAPVLLNADLKQTLRFAAIDKFKSLKSRVLVTTDLASRGLDIPQVDLIINYNCPKAATTYIHRVGRTCRTNTMSGSESGTKKSSGKALTFITQHDVDLIKSIETQIGIKLEKESNIDEKNVPNILKQVALATKEAELKIQEEDAGGSLKVVKHNMDSDEKRKTDTKKRKETSS